MRFKVYLLRDRGRRRRWRDVANGPFFVGDLRTHTRRAKEGYFEVACLMSSAPVKGNLVPDLYEPTLEGFSPLPFRLRGFERVRDPHGDFACVQEWHCELP